MPRLVADRLGKGLAEHDPDILDGMVVIDMQVAGRLHLQVDQRVAGERRQHMVEETDARGDLGLPRAVEVEVNLNICFTRNASESG